MCGLRIVLCYVAVIRACVLAFKQCTRRAKRFFYELERQAPPFPVRKAKSPLNTAITHKAGHLPTLALSHNNALLHARYTSQCGRQNRLLPLEVARLFSILPIAKAVTDVLRDYDAVFEQLEGIA